MTRVAVADRAPIVCCGMEQVLGREKDLVLAVAARTCRELLAQLKEQFCDVVLVDEALPDMSGLAAVSAVRSRWPGARVIVFSGADTAAGFGATAIGAGASGYLTKAATAAELVRAIREVAGGRRYITPETAEALASAVQTDATAPDVPVLSRREREVLTLYSVGKTVSEIADLLQINVRTVSTYKMRLLQKLDLKSGAELILYAIRNQLV